MISELTAFRSSAETGGPGWNRAGLDFMELVRDSAGETGGPDNTGLPFNFSVGGGDQFCCGSDAYSVAHSTRAAAASPRWQRAGSFRRSVCGGNLNRGQRRVSRGTMSPPSTIPQIGFKRPLVNLLTAVAALDRTAEEVLALVDEGRIAFAFNFASQGCQRRAVRILAQSIADFQAGKIASAASDEEQFSQAVRLIFPAVSTKSGGLQSVRAATVHRRLSLDHDHVANLCRCGAMRLVKGAKFRSGPNGSPEVEFSSVVEFLKRRRII